MLRLEGAGGHHELDHDVNLCWSKASEHAAAAGLEAVRRVARGWYGRVGGGGGGRRTALAGGFEVPFPLNTLRLLSAQSPMCVQLIAWLRFSACGVCVCV